VLLFALSLFTIGALIASGANNFTLLLVGRSIQGIGGGGLTALTYVIITDMVTLRDRGKWFSVISLQWAIGSVTGPVIGGAFTEKSTWRWIFWLVCGHAGLLIKLEAELRKRTEYSLLPYCIHYYSDFPQAESQGSLRYREVEGC
jgi:MFS family permease